MKDLTGAKRSNGRSLSRAGSVSKVTATGLMSAEPSLNQPLAIFIHRLHIGSGRDMLARSALKTDSRNPTPASSYTEPTREQPYGRESKQEGGRP